MEISSFEYYPRILVADSAKSITKGFEMVFELLLRIDCWTHVSCNIDKNLEKSINDIDRRKSIRSDIDIFQKNVEKESFIKVALLMVTKVKEMHGELLVNNFIKYFSKQWLIPKRM